MALLWMEGFEVNQYSTALSKFFTVETNYPGEVLVSVAGRLHGRAFCTQPQWTNSYFRLTSPTIITNGYMVAHFGYQPQNGHLYTRDVLHFMYAGTQQCYIRCTGGSAANTVKFQVRQGTTTIIESGDYSTVGNPWFWIECKVLLALTSAGNCTLKIDGVQVATNPNVRTAAGPVAGCDAFKLESWWGQAIDDFVLLDTTGNAPHNDYLGDVSIEAINVESPGSHTEWSVSGEPTNASAVFENPQAPPDADASYVYANADNLLDSYQFSDLLQLSGSILAVRPIMRARLGATGSQNLEFFHKDASNVEGTTASFAVATTNYKGYQAFLTVSPADGGGWDANDINSGQFGFKTVA